MKPAEVQADITVSPASQKIGYDVTVTVALKNGSVSGLISGTAVPSGIQIQAPDGLTVKTAPAYNAQTGLWTAVYTVSPTATLGNAQFTLTSTDNTNNYKAYTNTAPITLTDKGITNVTISADKMTGLVYGDSVTFTAAASKAVASDPDHFDGTIRFYLDGVQEANAIGDAQSTLDSASIKLDRDKLTAGDHTITAVYSGNGSFASGSAKVTLHVAKKQITWNTTELVCAKPAGYSQDVPVFGELRAEGILDNEVTFQPGKMTTVGFAETTVGTHTANVTFSGGFTPADPANYELPAAAPTVAAVINPVNVLPVSPIEGDGAFRIHSEDGISLVPPALKDDPILGTPAGIRTVLDDYIGDAMPGHQQENTVFFDAVPQVTYDGKTWVKATPTEIPAEGLTVTVPYPSGMLPAQPAPASQNGLLQMAGAPAPVNYNGKQLVAVGISVADGSSVDLKAKPTSDGVQITIKSETLVAIGWKAAPGGNDSGSSESDFRSGESEFWASVKDVITAAGKNDTVTVTAGGFDRMPVSVMDALRAQSGVTMTVNWNGGSFTIPAGTALTPESGRTYYALSYLLSYYSAAYPASQNPSTGGGIEIIARSGSEQLLPTAPGEGMTMAAQQPALWAWAVAAGAAAVIAAGTWMVIRKKRGEEN